MVYVARPGVRFRTSVQNVGAHIDHLERESGGKLTPSMVVDDARRPRSPIHPEFDFDDRVAAELHREEQARRLMRGYARVYTYDDGTKSQPVIANINVVSEDGSRAYKRTEDALANDEWRLQILQNAQSLIDSLIYRLKLLTDATEVVAALGKAKAAIARVAEREKAKRPGRDKRKGMKIQKRPPDRRPL